MTKLIVNLCVGALFFLLAGGAEAAGDSYSSGSVWRFSFIKARDGMQGTYLENLKNNYVHELEEAKKQKVILSYKIIKGDAATKDDWNVIIMLELKDMASLDTFNAKMDAISAKVIGEADDEKKTIARAQIRDYLGIKSGREIFFNK